MILGDKAEHIKGAKATRFSFKSRQSIEQKIKERRVFRLLFKQRECRSA